jgi:hypothetical protein
MTNDELAEVSEAVREQRDDIRDYLASEGVDVRTWDVNVDVPIRGADRDVADSD